MSKTQTSKKEPKMKSTSSNEKNVSKRERFQITLGIIFIVLGLFLTGSIVSYFFTWKEDQSNILSHQSIWDFLFKDDQHVYNWSGRLGALLSHLLVYGSLGVSAILFTVSLIVLGFKALNPGSYYGLKTWRKWLIFSVLFIAPVLSLLFPNTAINVGGALGVESTKWIRGLAGNLGNILLFSTIGIVFLVYVFKVNFKGIIDWLFTKSKKTDLFDEKAMNDEKVELQESKTSTDKETKEDDKKVETTTTKETALTQEKEVVPTTTTSSNDSSKTVHDLYLTNNKDKSSSETNQDTINTENRIYLELPEEAHVPDEEETTKEGDDTDFEININEKEEAKPAHGGHISIESQEPYDPSLDLRNYKFPTLDLLKEHAGDGKLNYDKEELENNKDQIIKTLRSFGIEIQKIAATVGPTVTLYEIIPAEGVRISKIKNLEDDIALTLAALGIRIIAPIPGRGTIGIEVPNKNKQIVGMRSMLSSEKFINNDMSLPIALGKKIDNENFIVDLATLPHLLMAGATGQGKSVGINAILVSLLYKKHPSQLKFVMIDPKKVELSIYNTIKKHYLAKLPDEEEAIITDVSKVVNTLNALGIEMDNRYELLKEARARNIKEYNAKFIKRQLNPNDGHKYLPFIVLVIDEFADLIMVAGKEVEMPIARLAQLARAVGIHIIIATQRPSVNVITGIIKANFPGRIAFKVSAKVDSRTILDAGGADQLVGKGDMLFSQGNELIRIQCAFVDTPEVERIVNFIGEQQGYPTVFELPEYEGEDADSNKGGVDLSERDKLFGDCADLVVTSQSGSTSMLQRRFNLGYNRAGRIMDQLEAAGIVGPQVGSKPRDVYVVTESELQAILSNLP